MWPPATPGHELLQLTLTLGYKASYAGDANHLPAQSFGSIIK